jgi:hypothetical protein
MNIASRMINIIKSENKTVAELAIILLISVSMKAALNNFMLSPRIRKSRNNLK